MTEVIENTSLLPPQTYAYILLPHFLPFYALEMKRKEIANNFVKTKVTKEKEDAEEV